MRKFAMMAALLAVLSASAAACADVDEAGRLRSELSASNAELEAAKGALAAADAERQKTEQRLTMAEKDLRWWKREAGRMTARVEEADRVISLHRACMDDIIYAYNSSTFAIELPRAIAAALNGSNCSALGYYAT